MDGKLFSGSHDGTLRVWDITGLKDDTNFGGGDESNANSTSSFTVYKGYSSGSRWGVGGLNPPSEVFFFFLLVSI